MNRTFTTASVVSLPTRRTTPSWMTRRSLAWIDLGISTSSSRNSVPPWAASSNPGLSRTAPVKAPLRWPNISDSSSPSGSAAQFTATKGRLGAEECQLVRLHLRPVERVLLLTRLARDQQRVHRAPDQHLQV